jgi:hypothetical protein
MVSHPFLVNNNLTQSADDLVHDNLTDPLAAAPPEEFSLDTLPRAAAPWPPASVRIEDEPMSVPTGRWRDGFLDCCIHGCCHVHCLTACFCPLREWPSFLLHALQWSGIDFSEPPLLSHLHPT